MIDTIFPLTFSNSMLMSGHGCELKWFRQSCQKLQSNLPKSYHLTAGGIFAFGCQTVREAFYEQNLSIDESIEKGYDVILKSPDTGDFNKSNDKLAFALKRYFEKFRLDGDYIPSKLSDGGHAIEYSFEIDLGIPHPEIPGRNISYKGKLDALMDHKRYGKTLERFIVDEKTTGKLPRITGTKSVDLVKLENEYKTSSQFISYAWAARALGVPTNEARVYKIPINKDNEEAVELPIYISDFMIDMWYISLINEINERVERYKYYKKTRSENNLPQFAFPPSFGSSCQSYGERCPYTNGCLTASGEAVLEASLIQKVIVNEGKDVYTFEEYKKLMGIKE